MRIITSAEGERQVDRLIQELGGGVERWVVMRIALSLSMRRQPPTVVPEVPRTGNPYDLKVVTGQGRKGTANPDITLALRALLSELHGQDLFTPGADAALARAIEFHIHRGLDELRARLERDASPWSVLMGLAGDGGASNGRVEPAVPQARLLKALAEVGVAGVRLVGEPAQGPRWTRYTLRLDSASHLGRLRAGREKLAFVLGLQPSAVDLQLGDEPAVVRLDLLRPPATWARAGLPDLRRWAAEAPSTLALPVCPGQDILGRPLWFDLATQPHLFLAGSTGSGKSVALHALLVSLVLLRGPADVQLGLYDAKRVELVGYRGLPHLLRPAKLLTEVDELVRALGELVDEMEARYRRFEARGVRSLAEARRRGEALPYLVFAIDELADAVVDPAVMGLLESLARKGRAAGVHLVLATQRPDAATFSGQLRTNIPSRLALWVQKASESKIILDEPGAEDLPRPGEILALLADRAGGRLARVHGVHLTESDVLEVVMAQRRSGP